MNLTFTNRLRQQLAADEPTSKATAPRLALRPREAVRALGIGERLLWSKTNAGEFPHLRIGRAVIYPIDARRNWADQPAGVGK